MPPAGPFRMVSVNGPPLKGGDAVFDESGLVQGIGVDGHLDIVFIGHGKGRINGRGRGTPVLMQFEPHGPGLDLFSQGIEV